MRKKNDISKPNGNTGSSNTSHTIDFLSQVRPEHLVPRPPVVYSGGEESTVLGLRFEVRSRHFQKSEMRLRCTATLSEVKKMTSEPLEVEIAEQQRSDLHVDQVNAESGEWANLNRFYYILKCVWDSSRKLTTSDIFKKF